jgi:hypothetical protein
MNTQRPTQPASPPTPHDAVALPTVDEVAKTARGRDPHQVSRAIKLYFVDGLTCQEAADEVGVTKRSVLNWFDDLGLERRQGEEAQKGRQALRARLLAEAGGCGSPVCRDPNCLVEPGQCHAQGCTNKAAIASQTNAKTGWVVDHPILYCDITHARSENARRYLTAGVSSEQAEAFDRHCREHGYWTLEEVAEYLVMTKPEVLYYEGRGLLLPAERVDGLYQSIPRPVFRPSDVRRFAVKQRDADYRARTYFDPHVAYKMASRRWPGRPDVADRAAERAKARKKKRPSIRATGRPTAAGPSQELVEIGELFEHLRAEYDAEYEREVELGLASDGRASDYEVEQATYEVHYGMHPEAWSYDPATAPDTAARRVRYARKVLQMARQKSQAA